MNILIHALCIILGHRHFWVGMDMKGSLMSGDCILSSYIICNRQKSFDTTHSRLATAKNKILSNRHLLANHIPGLRNPLGYIKASSLYMYAAIWFPSSRFPEEKSNRTNAWLGGCTGQISHWAVFLRGYFNIASDWFDLFLRAIPGGRVV